MKTQDQPPVRRERRELRRVRRVRAKDRQDVRYPGGGMLAEFRNAADGDSRRCAAGAHWLALALASARRSAKRPSDAAQGATLQELAHSYNVSKSTISWLSIGLLRPLYGDRHRRPRTARKNLALNDITEMKAVGNIPLPCRLISRCDQIDANRAVFRTQDAGLDDHQRVKRAPVTHCPTAFPIFSLSLKSADNGWRFFGK